MRLLDEEGADALSARNLAAALQCSTRTLYQQVGKREELIGQLIERHFANVELEFKQGENWQASMRNWASTLRAALLAHPNLARLMRLEHRGPVAHHVTQLLKVLLEDGFDEELALRCCRVLVNITISLTLSEIIAPNGSARHKRRGKREIEFEDLVISRRGADRDSFQQPPQVFENSIDWVISGIQAERASL